MSTRCQIVIMKDDEEKDLNNNQAIIYRHSDGYPKGVIPAVLPFLKHWSKSRGMNDTEYLSARLLQYLTNQHDGFNLLWHVEAPMKDSETETEKLKKFGGTLSYGISTGFTHGDIEYVYAIYSTKVVAFEVIFSKDKRIKDINKRVRQIGEVEIGGFDEELFNREWANK